VKRGRDNEKKNRGTPEKNFGGAAKGLRGRGQAAGEKEDNSKKKEKFGERRTNGAMCNGVLGEGKLTQFEEKSPELGSP